MDFSFIDDSRWNDLSPDHQNQMLSLSFNKEVASDSRFNALPDEDKNAMWGLYNEEAKQYHANLYPVEKPSLIGAAGKGLAHGTLGLGEALGTGVEYLGERIGGGRLAETGREIKQIFGEPAKKFLPSENIYGKNVVDNPELLANAEWWIYNVSDMVPMLASSILPGIAAQKGIMAVTAIPKLARIGGMAAGGLTGGAIEGSQTYNAVLAKGGTEEEAARAGELMTLGAGALNALSVGKVLARAGAGFKGKVIKHLGSASWEGITEGLEEPTEVFSKYFGAYLAGEELPTDLKIQLIESAKDALTVAPIAFVAGGGGSILAGTKPEDALSKDPELSTVADEQNKQILDDVIDGKDIESMGEALRTQPTAEYADVLPFEEALSPEELQMQEEIQAQQAERDRPKTQAELNQAIINKTSFKEPEIADKSRKSEQYYKLSAMQNEMNNSETGGVNQAQVNQEGETVRFKATSPPWMQNIQKNRKLRGEKALGRKEMNVIFDKVKDGKSLTEIQQSQYADIEDALEAYEGSSGEFIAIEEAEELAKKGYDLLGGESMDAGELSPGDKISGEVDGVDDEYTVQGFNKDGDVVFKDGVTKVVDKNATVIVDGIKEGGGISKIHYTEADRAVIEQEEQEKIKKEVLGTQDVTQIEPKDTSKIDTLDKIPPEKVTQDVTEKDTDVVKVKSFKTDEGSFSIYDTEKDVRGRANIFTVLEDKDGYIVRNAFVPDDMQRKGIATKFYIRMNAESLKKTGKPLKSTRPRELHTGEIVHELTPDAIAMWDSFVNKGMAIKTGEKLYHFIEPTTAKKTVLPSKKEPLKPIPAKSDKKEAETDKKAEAKETETTKQRIEKSASIANLEKIQKKGSARFANPKAVAEKINKYTDVEVEADSDSGTVRLKDKPLYSTTEDKAPGQGVSLKDIQSRFKNQTVTIDPKDGSINIRLKNGLGLKIRQVNKIDNTYAVQTGRMSKNGVILGKFQDNEITLNKDLASNFTRDHEIYHFLTDNNVITKADRLLLNGKFNAFKRKGKLSFKESTIKDKEIAKEENESNIFAQLLKEREKYRGTAAGRMLQRIVDFVDGLIHIGRMSGRKLAKEVETGKVFERKTTKGEDGGTFFQTAEPVKSKEFKKWFGDSKVVDDSGEPLVVYHGSPTGGFTVFDRSGVLDAGDLGEGYYFTSDAAEADIYSKEGGNSFSEGAPSPRIYKVYLSLQNPKAVTRLVGEFSTEQLKSEGFDGVILKGDNGSVLESVVFSPNQIKLTTTEKPTKASKDIRYQTSEDLSDVEERTNTTNQTAEQDGSKYQGSAEKGQESIENIMSTLRKTATTKSDLGKATLSKEQKIIEEYRKLELLSKDPHASVSSKQKMLASFLKSLPAKVRLRVITPLSAISRYKKIDTHKKRINEALLKTEKELVTHLRRGLVADITKGITPKKLAKNRIKKGTIGHEAERDLQFIRETLKKGNVAGSVIESQLASKEAALEEADETKSAILEEEISDLQSRFNIIETFGDLKSQNLEDLLFAKEALSSIVEDGRALWRAQQDSFKAVIEPMTDKVQQDISGKAEPTIETSAESTKRIDAKNTAWGKAKGTWDAVENSILSWEFLMNKLSKLSGGKVLQSYTTTEMGSVVQSATKNENILNIETDDSIHSSAMRIFNSKSDTDLNKKFLEQEVKQTDKVFAYDESGKKVDDFAISQMEAAYMYAVRKNDDSIPTFDKMGMTDQTFKEIEAFIGPELKSWVDYNVDEYLQDFHFSVNDVYRQVYGTNLTKTPGYISWYRDVHGKVQEKGIAASPHETGAKGMAKGAFKERVKNTNPFKFMSFNDVLTRHVSEMNNFKAWAMPTKVINGVFNNRKTQKLITQHHSVNMRSAIKSFQTDFTKSPIEMRGEMAWLDKMRGNITTAMTALNPTIFLKQLTSIPAMAESIPTNEWIKHEVDFWKNPLKAWNILKNSKHWESRRIRGMERDIRTAQAVSGSQAVANVRNLKNRAMFLVKWGDGAAILVGGYPVYKYNFDKNVAKMGKEKAHEFALTKFEEAMDRTQQASGIKDQGKFQRSGSYAKLFSMFMTAPKQYTSQITAAIRQIHSDPKDGDAYKRLFIFAVMMPSLFQATASGLIGLIGGDDDDEKKFISNQIKAILQSPLNGIPIIRDLQKGVWESAMGEWYGTDVEYSPVTQAGQSLLDAVFNGAKLVAGDDITPEKRSKHLEKTINNIFETVGYAYGLPVETVRKMFMENWTDIVTGETDYPVRRGLGFSRYATGEQASRFNRNKSKIKNAVKRRKDKEVRQGDSGLLRLNASLKRTEKIIRRLNKLKNKVGTQKAKNNIKTRIETIENKFNKKFIKRKGA